MSIVNCQLISLSLPLLAAGEHRQGDGKAPCLVERAPDKCFINSHLRMDAAKIESIVDRFTEGTDLFRVEVKISPMNEVEVTIDSDSAVTIDQCVALSRAIEAEFDRDAEDFELSVLSAGVGRPLMLERQYRKALGKPVEVVLKNGMKYAGVLEAADEKEITVAWEEKQLVEGKKRRQTVEVRQTFPLGEVKSTVRQLMFK